MPHESRCGPVSLAHELHDAALLRVFATPDIGVQARDESPTHRVNVGRLRKKARLQCLEGQPFVERELRRERPTRQRARPLFKDAGLGRVQKQVPERLESTSGIGFANDVDAIQKLFDKLSARPFVLQQACLSFQIRLDYS